jgi:hypothetical protein
MAVMFIVFYGHRDALRLFPGSAAIVGPCVVLPWPLLGGRALPSPPPAKHSSSSGHGGHELIQLKVEDARNYGSATVRFSFAVYSFYVRFE